MWYFALFIVVVVATGGLVVFYQPKNMGFSKLLLSFSGAYLFALIFSHLLPEIYSDGSWDIGLYILAGFLLQLALDFISKGIEHGHAHYHGTSFPLSIFIGLCLHSFFEGMPIIQTGGEETMHVNYALIWGIMIHKLPITIVLAGLLKQQFSALKSMGFIFIFAITLPLGSLTNMNIENLLADSAHFEHIVLAVVVGMMLHVSTTILYETDEGHKFNYKKVISILLGFIIAFFTS